MKNPKFNSKLLVVEFRLKDTWMGEKYETLKWKKENKLSETVSGSVPGTLHMLICPRDRYELHFRVMEDEVLRG